MRKMLLTSATIALLGLATIPASAMPVAPLSDAPTSITLVAMGCGPGWTRGPYGHCRPMEDRVARPLLRFPSLRSPLRLRPLLDWPLWPSPLQLAADRWEATPPRSHSMRTTSTGKLAERARANAARHQGRGRPAAVAVIPGLI